MLRSWKDYDQILPRLSFAMHLCRATMTMHDHGKPAKIQSPGISLTASKFLDRRLRLTALRCEIIFGRWLADGHRRCSLFLFRRHRGIIPSIKSPQFAFCLDHFESFHPAYQLKKVIKMCESIGWLMMREINWGALQIPQTFIMNTQISKVA